MFLRELLLEATSADILKSFFILTKTDGKFKSDKQKNFLLSQCNAGDGIFKLVQNLKFGPNNGASASVEWTVICDDEGVTKILKKPGTKSEEVYWDRTPEQMAKQAGRQSVRGQEMVSQLTELIRGSEEKLRTAEEEYKELVEYYEDWVEHVKPKLIATGGDFIEIADHFATIREKEISGALGLVEHCRKTLDNYRSELENTRTKYKITEGSDDEDQLRARVVKKIKDLDILGRLTGFKNRNNASPLR